MDKGLVYNTEDDIKRIDFLEEKLIGYIILNDKRYDAIIEKKEDYFLIETEGHHDIDHDTIEVTFYSDKINLKLTITINGNYHSIGDYLKSVLISKGTIYEMSSVDFDTKESYQSRSYYKIKNLHFFRNTFGNCRYLVLSINKSEIYLSHTDEYLIISSKNPIEYEEYFDICYNLLVAIGFVSGNFVQTRVFHFHRLDDKKEDLIHYRKIRNSNYSLYHSLTTNPYGYKHLIEREYADELYKGKVLKAFDTLSLSKLTELIMHNRQIQYALVLFCEANVNNASLLIKNNCFYVVLEVLKKFFSELFKESLPDGYSSMGNIEKHKAVFEQIVLISVDDIEIIRRRNTLLHGDIKDVHGDEMFEIMLKQITLIHRLVLTHIGFNGYIIDHYHLRNSRDKRSFIKLN